jgi:hypothetical protein
MLSAVWLLRFKTDDDVISAVENFTAWAGRGMVPTGCTCFSLAQGCRSGQRLCGKIGFGDEPSHLNMCYFHDF